jgi:ABC-type antimicrobial peptide transport system permease subunit
MEYEPFLRWVSLFLPDTMTYNTDFLTYLSSSQALYQFTDFYYYTLPEPRYQYYQSQNFETMKAQVTEQVDFIVTKFGFYQAYVILPLLDQMEDLQMAVVMLGCVFNVVLILMCAISTLLIYSLLMVSVEQKTFDNGVLRMVGTSKTDCILLVGIQTLSFVVPSLILSYCIAILCNYFLF